MHQCVGDAGATCVGTRVFVCDTDADVLVLGGRIGGVGASILTAAEAECRW